MLACSARDAAVSAADLPGTTVVLAVTTSALLAAFAAIDANPGTTLLAFGAGGLACAIDIAESLTGATSIPVHAFAAATTPLGTSVDTSALPAFFASGRTKRPALAFTALLARTTRPRHTPVARALGAWVFTGILAVAKHVAGFARAIAGTAARPGFADIAPTWTIGLFAGSVRLANPAW